MKRVWIFQAGEIGRVFAKYIEEQAEVAGFLVDDDYFTVSVAHGLPVLPYSLVKDLRKEDDLIIIANTGRPQNKEKQYNTLKNGGWEFYTYISPHAFVDDDVTIGEGSFIFENNVIQTGCSIGKNIILWSGNHIGHLTKIDDHCFLSSHVCLSARVKVGKRCFFGVNSAVAPFITIGDDATIGMGAVILRDVTEKEKIKVKDSRDGN